MYGFLTRLYPEYLSSVLFSNHEPRSPKCQGHSPRSAWLIQTAERRMPGRPGSLPRLSEEERQKWLLVKTKCDLGEVHLPFFALKDIKDKVDRLSLLSFKHLPLSYVPHHDLKLTILLPEGSLGERPHTRPQLLFTA